MLIGSFEMHNCKKTRERFTELLLDGADPRAVLAKELRECAECREEFGELSDTLRVTSRLLETATPPESYWPGYHARLKERLRAAQQPRVAPGQYPQWNVRRSWLTRFVFASIRVPVPVGLALIFIFGIAILGLIRVPEAEISIVHVPVEVPVTQEKTIERIVYREKKPTKSRRAQLAPPSDGSVATLKGFEPAEEVKLTVIKGGSANEK
jgi:hypothetical protein